MAEQNGIVMIPAIPPPKELRCRSIDFKLKPGWRFDEAKGVFIHRSGLEFANRRGCRKTAASSIKCPAWRDRHPKNSPALKEICSATCRLIPPSPRSTKSVSQAVQSLPAVEEAHLAPEISLPIERSSEPKSKR